VAVLAVLALVGALAGAWYFVTAQPAAGSAKPPASSSAPASAPTTDFSAWPTTSATGAAVGSATGSATAEPIVVDVVGKVASPGVVELPPGSRIRDAVAAAGGALPGTDLTALDLASRLSDGQEIFVGIPPPTGAAAQAAGGVVGGDPGADAGSAGASGGSSSSGVVSLNTATLAELETLPGVGPVLAQHILDWRTQHGRFTAVTQLQQVSGIGPSKYAALAGRVKL
jgi:competence protein ComEA